MTNSVMMETAMNDYKYQRLKISDSTSGVRTITLNRPERLNAVDLELAGELPAALDEASREDAIRVIVLTGAGRAFCAGLDLDPANVAAMTGQHETSRHEQLDDLHWVGRWVLAVTNCDKPVIAAINGPAVGAGCGLALAADIRLMSDSALLSTGYLRIGLSPDAGVSYFLPRLIGLARATELLLTARDIQADEAERIGLVSRTFPATDFESRVQSYAETLASGPPIALTLTRRLLRDSLDTPLVPHLRQELNAIKQCLKTSDTRLAIAAFREKQRPVFEGK
ncbi:MAG: enoyl-CoA hydratase [Acidobacteria bacterium]|nr:enoyl-CoA hydratase [Acidobacteriota bacterium]